MKLPELLEQKFLAWQHQQGKRKTLDDYAEYLGVGRSVLSNWLTGKRSPGAESLRTLASKLGFEVYDVLGEERPDPDLYYVEQQWETFTPKERRAIREQAEKYAAKNHPQGSSQKRRPRTSE